jgi:hypothetical protein
MMSSGESAAAQYALLDERHAIVQPVTIAVVHIRKLQY